MSTPKKTSNLRYLGNDAGYGVIKLQ